MIRGTCLYIDNCRRMGTDLVHKLLRTCAVANQVPVCTGDRDLSGLLPEGVKDPNEFWRKFAAKQ